MTITKLEFSKKAVQRAGEALTKDNVRLDDPALFRSSMKILSFWRSSHENTLNQVTSELEGVSNRIDRKCIVVKRLKRTASIEKKLKRFSGMKLRNMQDIAGCRSIMESTKKVNQVKRILVKKSDFKVTDYIKKPKSDGYRGIHLVGRFLDRGKNISFPVEIQLRSKIQHSWATAVEIVDLFTGQALKSNDGSEDWLNFFKFISHEFSKLEGINNQHIPKAQEESLRLLDKLDAYKKFEAFAQSIKVIEEQHRIDGEGYNLMTIHTAQRYCEVLTYGVDQFDLAAQDYLTAEKIAASKTDVVVALVSSQSTDNLKEAYPNYFADSALFVSNVRKVELKYRDPRNRSTKQFVSDFLRTAGFN